MRIFGKEVGTTAIVVAVVVLVAALGGAWYWNKNKDDEGGEGDKKAPTQPIPTGAKKQGLTVAGVGTVFYN